MQVFDKYHFCFCRDDSPITEVEPYIPFNINPAGMQPVLTTTYLLAFPSIVARLFFLLRVFILFIIVVMFFHQFLYVNPAVVRSLVTSITVVNRLCGTVF